MPTSKAVLWYFDYRIEYSESENRKLQPIHNLHFHNVYEIYYAFDNELLYFIGDKEFRIVPGTVIIIPPNVIHKTQYLNDKRCSRMLLYLPENFVRDFLALEPDLLKKIEVDPFLIKGEHRKEIEQLLLSIYYEFQKTKPSPVMQKSLLGQFLVTLGKLITHSSDVDSLNTVKSASNQIMSIVKYINENFSEKITLELLAQKFFLNPSYISRAFKEQLNISFTDYLKSVRIKEICVLLQNSSLSIIEIAERTGFDSSTALCRTFKVAMDMTPLHYRKLFTDQISGL